MNIRGYLKGHALLRRPLKFMAVAQSCHLRGLVPAFWHGGPFWHLWEHPAHVSSRMGTWDPESDLERFLEGFRAPICDFWGTEG